MLRTIDLFAGIGGVRTGFENTGFFETVFANDFDPYCKKTYDSNFDTAKLTVKDIRDVNIDSLPEFDFLIGGFPCQAFSIAGYQEGFNDKKGRGNLFKDVIEILEKKQPVGFMLENVKNLKKHNNGETLETIIKELKGAGYFVDYDILNTMNHGNIPQTRERIFIIGFKDEKHLKHFKFPDKIPLTKKIEDLLEENVDDKYYYNKKPLYEKLKGEITKQNTIYQWRRIYVRENKSKVCPTLTANMGMGGHNVPIINDGKGIRKLTPRECLRFQGFKDTYKLPKKLADSQLYKQIGNSVSVTVIEAMANQIKEAIQSESKIKKVTHNKKVNSIKYYPKKDVIPRYAKAS